MGSLESAVKQLQELLLPVLAAQKYSQEKQQQQAQEQPQEQPVRSAGFALLDRRFLVLRAALGGSLAMFRSCPEKPRKKQNCPGRALRTA